MTDLSNDSKTLALSPPYIVDATPDVKSEDPTAGVPLLGVPLRLTGGGHLKVVVDPPSPGADSVVLHLNGSVTPIDAPVTVDPVTKRTTFEVSRALLRNGLQYFNYVAKRIGGSDEPSPNLWVLYSRDRPGGLDPIVDDQDIHEGLVIDLPEDVKQSGVDLVAAERGVPLTVSYAFAKLHDVVTVNCNGFPFNHIVTAGDIGGGFDILLPKAAFIGGGNSLTFKIFYTVKDQLGNSTQNSLPSPALSIKVDLTPKVELPPAPFVPALAGNVIFPGKHTAGFVVRVDWTKGFKPGDRAKLVVKGGAAGAGTPVFNFVAFNANFRANFQLTPAFILANAGREVVFTWTLLSGGVETGSEPLTLIIESVNVTDTNFPKPEIVEAYGTNAVDLRAFTGDAKIVCAPWPFIGVGQKYWLHVLGTGMDDNPKTVPIAVGKTLTPEEIHNGLNGVVPRKELELFKPGHQLRARLRVDFYPNENVDTIRTFTLTYYTLVTAGMKAILEFINAPYRVAPLGRLTDISLKLVDETGNFIREASVHVTIPGIFRYSDGTTGRREFKTSLLGELVIRGVTGPDAPATNYTITAEYNGKTVIAKLNVTARGAIGEVDLGFVPHTYIGHGYHTLMVSPDGTKICVMKPANDNGSLAIIDAETLQMSDKSVARLNAFNFAIGLDSNQVFISSTHSYSRTVYDLSTGTQVLIPTNTYNSGGCVFDREGAHAYVTSQQGLRKTDIVFKREKDIPGPSSSGPIILSSDGRRIFTFAGGSLYSIDTSNDTLVKVVSQGWNANTIAISPDGKRLYADDRSSPRIRVINPETLLTIQSVDVLKPGLITLSPDGRILFFASEGAVTVLDSLSLKEVKTFPVQGDPCALGCSPDGSRLYIAYKSKTSITAIQV